MRARVRLCVKRKRKREEQNDNKPENSYNLVSGGATIQWILRTINSWPNRLSYVREEKKRSNKSHLDYHSYYRYFNIIIIAHSNPRTYGD